MMLQGIMCVWVMHSLKHIKNAIMFVNSKSEKICHVFVHLNAYLIKYP